MPLQKVILEQPEDLETGKAKLDIVKDAYAALQARGLVLTGKPLNNYAGEMPQQLTSLDDKQLGDLLNNLAQWCGFVEEELSKAEADMKGAKSTLEFIEARIRIAIRAEESSKKMTVQDKNDIVITDPRTVVARSRALYTAAVYDLTKTLLNTAQRDWETVSRRITQRGQDIERMKRENNVAGVPSAAAGFRRPGQQH